MTAIQIPKINLLPFQIGLASQNMAIDQYLLSLNGTYLRFYGWQNPTLSFGRLGQGVDSVDIDFCRENGVDIIKRISGGRALLHQYELTYVFVSDVALFDQSIMKTYQYISQALATGLERTGVSTEMSSKSGDGVKSSICFEQASAYELTSGGKKLVGSAQYRKKGRFFQHGSILMNIDWNLWKRIWGLDMTDRRLEKRVTTVNDILGEALDEKRLASSLADAFAESFGADLITFLFDEEDLAAISDLARGTIWCP